MNAKSFAIIFTGVGLLSACEPGCPKDPTGEHCLSLKQGQIDAVRENSTQILDALRNAFQNLKPEILSPDAFAPIQYCANIANSLTDGYSSIEPIIYQLSTQLSSTIEYAHQVLDNLV